MNRIITVGREFGSGGREIGRKIAQELGIAYYDHEIVTELIRRTNLAEEYIRSIEEKNPVPVFAVTTGRTFLSISNPAGRSAGFYSLRGGPHHSGYGGKIRLCDCRTPGGLYFTG